VSALEKTKKLLRLDLPVELLVKNEDNRFWSKVMIGGPDECWPWLASFRSDGYGAFQVKINGKWRVRGAHQVAFALSGKTTPGDVRHSCDNRACCNPAHLLAGTRQDNIHDAFRRGRLGLGEAHHSALYSDEFVAQVRERYASGEFTYLQISQATGVPKSTVQSWCGGLSRVSTREMF
jgi:hypothetical protein